jgi:hypothetical protein
MGKYNLLLKIKSAVFQFDTADFYILNSLNNESREFI